MFWTHDANGNLKRTHRSRNVRVAHARYPFEITLHQGAIENIFIDAMSTRGLLIDRPTTVHDWRVLPVENVEDDYRIEVTLRHLIDETNLDNAELPNDLRDPANNKSEHTISNETIIHAKYIIGCDGAHSWVRKKLGFTMVGEQTGKCLYHEFIGKIADSTQKTILQQK
jgi:phenol 2-monooxygenase